MAARATMAGTGEAYLPAEPRPRPAVRFLSGHVGRRRRARPISVAAMWSALGELKLNPAVGSTAEVVSDPGRGAASLPERAAIAATNTIEPGLSDHPWLYEGDLNELSVDPTTGFRVSEVRPWFEDSDSYWKPSTLYGSIPHPVDDGFGFANGAYLPASSGPTGNLNYLVAEFGAAIQPLISR